MPDELSHTHKNLGREVRSGVAICEEIDRPIKLSGRALYDDGQMINPNVINHHQRAFGVNSFSTNMAAVGELKCGNSSLF